MKEVRKRIFTWLLAASLVFPMLSKPALAEEQVIINESPDPVPDPDLVDLQAAKASVENAEYPAANQEEQSTQAAATSYVEQLVKQAVNNEAIGLSIHVDEYTAPKSSDADFPEGTDGQIAFTVTLTKGAQVLSTARRTVAIKATPYAGVSNQQVIDKAGSLFEGELTMDVELGTTWAELYNMITKRFNDLLAEFDLDYVWIVPNYPKPEKQTITVNLYFEKGRAYYSSILDLHINQERDPDLAKVKTAIEHGDYGGIRQSTYDDRYINQFVSNRAYDAISHSGVNNAAGIGVIRVGTITGLDYVPSVTGDADNPSGTNGSYTFTVTFYRAWQVWTTDPITVPILATTLREVNEQALAAVKAALVDGEVDVAFGASQADKTAAVQNYVNRLLAGDPKVTASVAYNSDTGGYDVALVRGNASDSKSLTMTMKEAVDPDIAVVAAARAAVEGASYPGTTQAAHGDEAAAKSYVENQARAAVNNSEVTITATKVSYTAPIAGDGDHLNGTDGSYTFTVTVAKGSQSQTTAQHTIEIKATAFGGVSNEQAVAAAKAALVDGIVDVVFQPSQADKTTAVQSYVNRLLVGDAAGVTAIVTFNSVGGSYDVALSKGARTDSTSLHVTFNEAPDPDIAILQAAREAVENAEYPAGNQEEQSTEAAATSYVEQKVKQAVNNEAIGLSIHVDEYTAPKAGDADFPDGTDGQVAFTVTLTKGAQVQTSARRTVVIKATPYAGVSNREILDRALSLLAGEHPTIEVPPGSTWLDLYAIVERYFKDLLANSNVDYVTVTPERIAIEGQLKVNVYLEEGNYLSDDMDVILSLKEEPDAYLADVKTALQQGNYGGFRPYEYYNGSINSTISSMVFNVIRDYGLEVDRVRVLAVKEQGYVPPITGDADHPNGTDGSYTFTITYVRFWQGRTTAPITVPILATPYDGLSNAQAVAAAKTALVDGTVDVAFGASQADKTAAVQSYVNGLLVGDAAEVTAIVTYNSVSGSYDVTFSKGSASDSKNLTMTVKEAADPDIAIVTAAKAAVDGVSYNIMTQAEATSESIIAAVLKATAEAAINNNVVTVTINKVSYTAPIAGVGDNVNGTEGSYIFTVTVGKGLQSQTTTQQTIAIKATAFNGVTNAQAVAAAKTALVDGTVDVAFGASQADKTAAVQSYVNFLLTGDAAGVTANVIYNNVSGKYDVALSKGSASDSKSLMMSVRESADPDIAIVDAAKTAADNVTYPSTTQTAHGDEAAVKSYVENLVKTAINNNAVTVTITKVTYTAPTAGDADNPQSIDGVYTFTVTVAKGQRSQNTAQHTITITATAFNGVTNAQAVAEAKAALVDGTVDVAFGALQADKTAAVQSYVNSLLVGDAAGVTATVVYNSVSGNYDVALSKGSASDSASLKMTVNESADPDIAIVAAAKGAVEDASYPDAAQAAYGDETAVKNYVENQAREAINNNGVTVTVTKINYTAPTAGDAENPQGTDGSYVFSVKVAKGQQSQTTAQQTIAITATSFIGVTNAQAVAAAKTALVDGTVDVAFGASQADKTTAVQSYVNSLLTGDAAGVTATIAYNSGNGKYDVALSKGSATDSKSLMMSVKESADPDIAIVAAAKSAAEVASYSSMTQAAATSESVIVAALKVTAEAAVKNSNVAVTINKVSYTAPVAGTTANRSGTDGSYVFTVTVVKGAQSQTTGQIRINITATADTSGGIPGGSTPGGNTPGGTTPGGTTEPGGNTPGGGSEPGGGTSSNGISYADVNKSDWFFDAVAYVQHKGLMSGTSETTFKPNQTANRAMIATVLYRMAGSPQVTGESTFNDVPSGTWYTDAIKWVAQSSIASGYSNKRYGIDDAVTREQLVTLLYRYAQHTNLDITVTGDLSDFADKDKISDWATVSMKWAIGKGIISGKGNGLLDPSGTATRAEIAAILMRFLLGQDSI
ncbi:S-layer homology domain-containing protein [Cohnella soli]|uniref:S-layer homology domain-containing protein n=1 Tax=Cohnella soli TaxID=425005 RepID=A0ABW0HTZ9_9BACL